MTDFPRRPSERPSSEPPPSVSTLVGIAGSPGVAVGRAFVVGDPRAACAKRHVSHSQVPAEIHRFDEAVRVAKEKLVSVSARVSEGPLEPGAILGAYLAMLDDPMLHAKVRALIEHERRAAEWAVVGAGDEISRMFLTTTEERDSYIAERRHDVEFVCDRILLALLGRDTGFAKLSGPHVVVARDLSPADTAGMVREPVIGFVTEIGSRTSHTALMARALEIPAVVGASDALTHIRTGDILVVDGLRGEVHINPSAEAVAEARARAEKHLNFARGLLRTKALPAQTEDGTRVALRANVELPAEAILALDHGAEGIGLYRTEFVYIDRLDLPSEEEQYSIYRAVVETVAPHPVTLRTFDIGGDKYVSSFQLPPEMNPALGLRAVRLALSRPEVLKTQLRAMVRASAHGDVRIMVPMVANLEELREVRALLGEAEAEIESRGLPFRKGIPLGIMVEVPGAAIMADVFAKEAAFFSLGTNDLVQYTLAVDRTNRSLAPFASPMHPAVLRLIRGVRDAASRAKIPLSVCGAMASDPLGALLLVGLGVSDLSMEAAAIPEVKEALRRLTKAACVHVAERALMLDTADAVHELVTSAYGEILRDVLMGEAAS